jgi:hypothetical protein
MKNSAIVSEWLDACQDMLDCIRSPELEILDQARELNDRATELWHVCQNGGWTIAELDEIYGRRFHVDVAALRRS